MKTLDFTHSSDAECWVASAQPHPQFPVQNLPLGSFTPPSAKTARGGMAIGDEILDLRAVAHLLKGDAAIAAQAASAPVLNNLLELGNGHLRQLRQAVFQCLTDKAQQAGVAPHLYPAAECTLHVPLNIRDYTDFYTGIHHAMNIGKQFRPDNPLLPNYKHVPIGYHGRSSSIRVSGAAVTMPSGQIRPAGQEEPTFLPSKRLDYELEMAIWVGQGNALGKPIEISDAGEHIAGISILNDWSARDMQAWEYQPLGPFLAKSFHSTVSPWIVTMDALAPYAVAQPARPEGDPEPLPYLWDEHDQKEGAYPIVMEVTFTSKNMREQGDDPIMLSRGLMSDNMYWTPAQLIAHHSSNGCNLQSGDLLGTGTLSGASEDSMGSLMEITQSGKKPLTLPDGSTRSFLEAGDEIIITAYLEKAGYARIGFGECRAQVTM